MDDWVVLAETRARLRRAVRIANATLAELGLEKHPEKTFIGPIARGFDVLGYRFRPEGLELAPAAVRRLAQRLSLLYEQGADPVRTGSYVKHWVCWANGGLSAPPAGPVSAVGAAPPRPAVP